MATVGHLPRNVWSSNLDRQRVRVPDELGVHWKCNSRKGRGTYRCDQERKGNSNRQRRTQYLLGSWVGIWLVCAHASGWSRHAKFDSRRRLLFAGYGSVESVVDALQGRPQGSIQMGSVQRNQLSQLRPAGTEGGESGFERDVR